MQVINRLALLERRPNLEMAVLISPVIDDVGHLTTRVDIVTGIPNKRYILPTSQAETDVRVQWEAAVSGAEDIWERAARLSAAVSAQDSETIKQFWWVLGREWDVLCG